MPWGCTGGGRLIAVGFDSYITVHDTYSTQLFQSRFKVFPELKRHKGKALGTRLKAISFPEHARSQVKGGHGSGEIELIQACDWLTADNTLDFQREFYINKVFGISRRKFYTFYTEID